MDAMLLHLTVALQQAAVDLADYTNGDPRAEAAQEIAHSFVIDVACVDHAIDLLHGYRRTIGGTSANVILTGSPVMLIITGEPSATA